MGSQVGARRPNRHAPPTASLPLRRQPPRVRRSLPPHGGGIRRHLLPPLWDGRPAGWPATRWRLKALTTGGRRRRAAGRGGHAPRRPLHTPPSGLATGGMATWRTPPPDACRGGGGGGGGIVAALAALPRHAGQPAGSTQPPLGDDHGGGGGGGGTSAQRSRLLAALSLHSAPAAFYPPPSPSLVHSTPDFQPPPLQTSIPPPCAPPINPSHPPIGRLRHGHPHHRDLCPTTGRRHPPLQPLPPLAMASVTACWRHRPDAASSTRR